MVISYQVTYSYSLELLIFILLCRDFVLCKQSNSIPAVHCPRGTLYKVHNINRMVGLQCDLFPMLNAWLSLQFRLVVTITNLIYIFKNYAEFKLFHSNYQFVNRVVIIVHCLQQLQLQCNCSITYNRVMI